MIPDLSILRDDLRAIGAGPAPSATGTIERDAMEPPLRTTFPQRPGPLGPRAFFFEIGERPS